MTKQRIGNQDKTSLIGGCRNKEKATSNKEGC